MNCNLEMPIQNRLKCCQDYLQDWNRKVFGNVNKVLKQKQKRLQQLEEMNLLHESVDEIQGLKNEVNEMMLTEEMMWNQRSRALWIKCGDRNTKFFHATTNNRQRKNRIEALNDLEGRWREGKKDVEDIILKYFNEIYSTTFPIDSEASLGAVGRRVSEAMNAELLKEFKEEEVWRALMQMHPTKSPSLDGMSPIFFQKYWDVVGPQVTQSVIHILRIGIMPNGMNDTYICLIPKVKSPQKITEYRPISLCNVIYKIIAKVLANRLKGVLPEVISDAQSAFVPGRQITDNVLVAFEVMHCINQRRKGKEGLMAIKLDMSKAYDRVKWGYLEATMRKMGFQERWISLMMMCVNTVSYSMLINGEPNGRIAPTRGLRNGDPISPYLFLLCAEGLSAMLRRDKAENNFRGISVCRGAPRVSHLLFADDCIVFYKASVDEGLKVTNILE